MKIFIQPVPTGQNTIAQDGVERRRNAILGERSEEFAALKGRDKLSRPFRAGDLFGAFPGVALSLHPRLSYRVPLGRRAETIFRSFYRRDTGRSRSPYGIIVWFVLLIFSCWLTGCQKKAAEEEKKPTPVVEVKTAQAEITDLALTVQSPATIFPREQANIAARITARIVKLNARKGDTVAAGQTLAVLENRDLLAQRDEAKAVIAEAEANLQKTAAGTVPADLERARGQVDVAKATLNQAQKNYDRRKDLFDKGAIPQRDLLVSETDLAQAKSGYLTELSRAATTSR